MVGWPVEPGWLLVGWLNPLVYVHTITLIHFCITNTDPPTHRALAGEINNIDKSQQNLFPSKATHQQLLVLEKKDIAPDAHAPPPMPIRHKKWLGPARGWEGAP